MRSLRRGQSRGLGRRKTYDVGTATLHVIEIFGPGIVRLTHDYACRCKGFPLSGQSSNRKSRMELFFDRKPINSRHGNTAAWDGGGWRSAAMELQLRDLPRGAFRIRAGSASHPIFRRAEREWSTLVSAERFAGYSRPNREHASLATAGRKDARLTYRGGAINQ